MRSSLLTRGVSATAAVLLLSACGGGSDDDQSAPSTTSAASSSAAETSSAAPAGGSEFCTQAEAFGNSVSESFSSGDPAQLSANLQEAAEGVRAIEPPDEIAGDWTTFADGLEDVASTLQGADPNDPEVAAKVQAQIEDLGPSVTNVQAYLQEECGIDAGASAGSESPAPSS